VNQKVDFINSQKSLIKEFSNNFGLSFQNPEILLEALTHSSFSNESRIKLKSNERMEYLGDSVLGLVVNEYLFHNYKKYLEGDLAKLKSFLVSEHSLAFISRKMDLGKFLLLSKGEEHSGGRTRDSILADGLEALIAAIYIDQGLEEARKFIFRFLIPSIESANATEYKKDYKSYLQEIIQKKFGEIPIYKIVKEEGPDHQKSFTAKVLIMEKEYGEGQGATKKKAEQNAAQSALENKKLKI
jgi:ribonuclease-3